MTSSGNFDKIIQIQEKQNQTLGEGNPMKKTINIMEELKQFLHNFKCKIWFCNIEDNSLFLKTKSIQTYLKVKTTQVLTFSGTRSQYKYISNYPSPIITNY